MRRRFRAVVPQRWKAFGVVAAVAVAVAFAGVAAFLALSSGHDKAQKNTTAIKATAKQSTKAVVKATGAGKKADLSLQLNAKIVRCSTKKTFAAQKKCLGLLPGAPGRPGVPGLAGTPGKQGSGGAPGQRGPRGLSGPEGGPGPASTVAGPKGDSVKGDQGEAGFGYDCAGNQVKPGDAPAKCPGDQGPAGKDGVDGKDGAPGADGATGQQGPQGNPGPAPTSLTCVPAVDPGVFTCTPN